MSRISRWICLLFVSSLLIGCDTMPKPSRPALINHVIFFKLKSPATADELIADCDKHLTMIPGVASYYSGKHFAVRGANVDSDYDVAVYLGFMSQKDYEDYLAHPTHIRLQGKWQPRLQWQRAYDTIDRTR